MKTEDENSGLNVLVVEDSRTQAEYLRHILENEGFQVFLAASGDDALEQIRAHQPSIILTDILMPGMDGYALCHAIKQDESMAHIPIILVTQLFDPADMIKGLEAGADNIIIKPFEPEQVMSRITTTLQSRKPRSPGDTGSTVEVTVDGETHRIPASRFQTPTILLSTYDLAVRKNAELQEAYGRLTSVNEDLQRTNENLTQENSERKMKEEALVRENKRLQMMATLTRDTLISQLTSLHECLEQVNTIREKDPALAWEYLTKAELLINQTIKALR
jgi:DNA-binding response OmpR family regulator